jgi:hypothetical protein
MNSISRFIGAMGIIILLPVAQAQAQRQSDRPGELSISGSINYQDTDPCATRGQSIDLTIREAGTNRLVVMYNTCDFMALRSDTLTGCYGRPGPCPSAVVFMHLADGMYIVSAELHDSTFQLSHGERGVSKVLGYYVADRSSADTTNITKPQQATVLPISGGQRSHRILLRIW